MRLLPIIALVLSSPVGAQPAPRLALFAPLDSSQPIGYFIGDPVPESGGRPSDVELCEWALADWEAQSEGVINLERVSEAEAVIQIHFVPPGAGQYGEMRPIVVNGRRGAAVFVRPETDALGPDIAAAVRADELLRETVVYLTCLHELGHAFGLEHTANFSDVMYFFGFGGDVVEFFGRFRGKLEGRNDISRTSGLSSGDVGRLRELYPARP